MTRTKLSRRDFLHTLAAGIGTFSVGPVIRSGLAAGQRSERPNILFLFTDDQRWDAMGCAGNPIVRTPEMDRLAAEGVRFEYAFVTTPICAASRASVFTGMYERTHGNTFGTPPLAKPYIDLSYPVRLREAGYRTGFVGKFGVEVAEGSQDRMFDWYRPMFRTPYFKTINGKERHLTDIIADEAIQFITDSAGQQPFCLSVSYNAPHAEDNDPRQYIPPRECENLYEDVVVPEPVTGSDEFFESQPLYLKQSLNRIRWYWKFGTPAKYQEMVKDYYRMVSGIDRTIGRIREALQRAGVAENTVIILMGDNGYFLGERGFAGKWYMYDLSIQVPLIVYDPRIANSQRGRVSDDFALNIDLSPTMLDLAGVHIPGAVQGRSLMPLITGEPGDWREFVFCEHLFERYDIPQSEGIRTDRWKYLRYRNQVNSEELYDLYVDPHETENLAWRDEYQEVLVELRRQCDEMIERLEKEKL
ncbi:MAG TPA: sulfatase [bacterium]|nr:sulfatase [bacterium]